MSGAVTIATIASAVAAAAGTGYGIYAGQKNQGAQKKALAQQTTAQQTAEANALSTERKGEVAQNAANQKTPNVAAILAKAAQMGNGGISSTMLTGPSGVNADGLNLGKSTLLGS